MFSAEMINSILAESRIKRDVAIAEADARRDALAEQIPGLKEIDSELSNVGMRIFAVSMDKDADLEAEMKKIEQRTEFLHKERERLLTEHGLPADHTDPVFECALCDDTGYVEDKLCSCVIKEAAKRLFAQSGIGDALKEQTFDNFDLRLYGKKSERDQMQTIFGFCRDYASGFSRNSESLLFIGGTGLGKTHISSAIAQTVITKGYTVMYESAQSLFDNYEAKRFGRDPDVDVKIYSECDLLIIDDLGAEHVTQFTTATLYNLINQRKINKRPMIISTNLTGTETRKTYNQRITSRLFGEFRVLQFCGQDIRMLKVKE